LPPRAGDVNSDSKARATYDQFKTYRLDGLIPFAVCYGDPSQGKRRSARRSGTGSLTHSNVTFKNFWLDANAYNMLGNYTGPGWVSSINSEIGSACLP
jgi:hypothetical protein